MLSTGLRGQNNLSESLLSSAGLTDKLGLDMEALIDSFVLVSEDCKLSLENNDRQNDRMIHARKFLQKYEEPLRKIQACRWSCQDFRRVRKLADGAHGEVSLVERLDGSRPTREFFAMKKMPKADIFNNPEAGFYMEERDVMIEATTSSWLTAIHCAFQDASHLYLLMDYIPGGDLMSLMLGQHSESFDEPAAQFYAAEIVLALDELHGRGFVHRDLKPDNILIDKDGHIKLADFGACIKLSDRGLVDSAIPVGTPQYISPEVLQAREGKGSYGRECDWWSLGVLLFEMLMGYLPFENDSLTGTFAAIMNHKKHFLIPSDASISAHARDLLQRLVCDRETRLGKSGAEEIQRHPFFQGILWDAMKTSKASCATVSALTFSLDPAPHLPPVEAMEKAYVMAEEEAHATMAAGLFEKKTRNFYGYHLPFVGYSFSRKPALAASSSGLALCATAACPQNEAQERREELARLDAELCAERARMRELEARVAAQESARAELERDADHAQRLYASEMAAKRQLEIALLTAQFELDSNKSASARCEQLTRQLEEKTGHVLELTAAIDGLSSEMERQKQICASLESLCRKQKEMLANLGQETGTAEDKAGDGSALACCQPSFESEKSVLMSQLGSLHRELSLQSAQSLSELGARDRELALKAKELAMLQNKMDECIAKLADAESQLAELLRNSDRGERMASATMLSALESERADRAALATQVEQLTEKAELDRIKIESLISKLEQTLVGGMGPAVSSKQSSSAEDKKALILARQEVQNLKMRLESALAERQKLQIELQEALCLQQTIESASFEAQDHCAGAFKRSGLKPSVSLQSKSTIGSDHRSNLSSIFVQKTDVVAGPALDASTPFIGGWLKMPMTGSQGLFRSKWRKVYVYVLCSRLYVGEKENDHSSQKHPLIDLSTEFISIRPALAVELPRLPSREIPCAFKILVSHDGLSTPDSRLLAESSQADGFGLGRSALLDGPAAMDTAERLASLRLQIEKEERLIEAASRMKALYESTLSTSLASKKKSSEMVKQVNDTEKQLEGYCSLLAQLRSQYEALSSQSPVGSETAPASSISSDADSLQSTCSLALSVVCSRASAHKRPAVEFRGHAFTEKAFSAFTTCMHCRQLLYGAKKHFGYQCQDCGYICHKTCYTLLDASCQDTIASTYSKPYFFIATNEAEAHYWISTVQALAAHYDKRQ